SLSPGALANGQPGPLLLVTCRHFGSCLFPGCPCRLVGCARPVPASCIASVGHSNRSITDRWLSPTSSCRADHLWIACSPQPADVVCHFGRHACWCVLRE